ncbi:MAG: UDP-3-O-(3-hydroxymyristoyl)glucosamine N-acyltransferase [Candidatus Marinimicrobia bacterium]|nr:UDP-3-O-(3-hydroxymyristoyl)glucosamine N-acyltransferase [Candidatus Neomarinimicrobiota bacterium]
MYTIQDLANLVDGSVVGNPQTLIRGASEIQSGKPDTITFLANPKYKTYLTDTKASAVIVNDSGLLAGKTGIVVNNPQLAFAIIMEKFSRKIDWFEGIHPTAVIHETSKIDENISIGAFCVIEKNAKIGEGSKIGAHSIIGESSVIGKNSTLHAHVTMYHHCECGDNAIIHSGSVIGSDGYGFVQSGETHVKIPQNGKVIIENDVEMGSNCTIDRGTIGDTRIGSGTKLDNQVHIAHNVKIGRGCLITGHVGIAGSATIGDFCIFAGQCGVAPHVTIGDRAIFAAKSGVTKSLPGGKVYAGMPAREIRETNRRDAIYSQTKQLKKRLELIEAHLNLAGSNDT